MKTGTDRESGRLIGGVAYLRQRLADVINTPLGSLVARREFGSRMHEMTDRSIGRRFYMDAYVRLTEAVNNPVNGLDDFKLDEMTVSPAGDGRVEIGLSGTYLSNGKPITMEGIILDV
ncbi:hypothetical protein HQQ94_05500 [Shewanella sp. VB17]|uniref:hypothetical protein n=1 Tax=Shewanella sp. VB17 TaxID=2739432 RepID=UPI001566CD6E|nr:hypothetical protein [Shewanella sp. VB17]NRD72712.1 hypothetical protein [Shewanella sp. VB17]